MAHGLNAPNRAKLHQALHGYADGHRQLALSLALKPRDQKILLALSDISGPGARLDDEGYLTGYPLLESGYYALGRTWPAPEMHRPGCVWTHTLLIDFADLATFESLEGLASLFRRPSSLGLAKEYNAPKLIVNGEIWAPSYHVPLPWARKVLAALYGMPRDRIVVMRPPTGADAAALAIWSQQWPRLRRSFRFCTLASSDRSLDNASFDLQLLPSMDRAVRSRFTNVIDASAISTSTDEWVDDAVSDLLAPDGTGLRMFLRQVGADIVGSREAFRPLCRLHRVFERFDVERDAVDDAIEILQDSFGEKQGRMARTMVAKAALVQVERLSARSFDFLWKNLSLIDRDALSASAPHLVATTWRRDPTKLLELESHERGLPVVSDQTFGELSLGDLLEGLVRAPELLSLILERRPDIVTYSSFWNAVEDVELAFKAVKLRKYEKSAVMAIVEARRTDLASRVVREFGSVEVLAAISGMPAGASDELSAWIRAAAVEPVAVAEFLATQTTVHRRILLVLASVLPPDVVPNEFGTDPWLIAWRRAEGHIDQTATSYLAAYLLSRALGSRSRSAAELAQVSFETVYWEVAYSRVSDSAWSLLEHRLPWSIFWFEWDRCHRLRVGIVELFVNRDLSPSSFGHLTIDDELFFALAKEAARSSRGRDYLKRVSHRLSDEENGALASRIRAIEMLVN